MPWMSNGAAMIVPTVCRGFSDENGSWKMICTSRRNGRIWRRFRCVMSAPWKVILPSVGSSRRVTSRPVVDLPQPDSPTRPSVSPAISWKSIPSTALTAPVWRWKTMPWVTGKCRCRPSTSSSTSPRTGLVRPENAVARPVDFGVEVVVTSSPRLAGLTAPA
jgi:hypothetical protein